MMKKTLLLSALALGLISSTAGAFTPDQFIAKGNAWEARMNSPQFTGGTTAAYYTDGDFMKNVRSVANGAYLSLDEFVDVLNFTDASGSQLVIQINNNNFSVVSTNEANLSIQTGLATNGYPWVETIPVVYLKQFSTSDMYILTPLTTSGDYTKGKFTGKVSQLSDGNYRIEMGPYAVARVTYTQGNYVMNGYITSGRYYRWGSSYTDGGRVIQTYSTNADITDTYYNYDGSSKTGKQSRNYAGNVEITDNKITIENFCNLGRPYTASGNNNSITGKESTFDGTFDNNTLEFTLNNTDVHAKNASGWYYLMMAHDYNTATRSYTPINGAITAGGAAHSGTNLWMNQLNNKTTLKSPVLKIDDYMFVYHAYNTNNPYLYKNYVENTTIKLKNDLEYTHDLGIKATTFGYGQVNDRNGKPYDDKNYIYINASLENMKNSKYVESYELYLMPTVANPIYNTAAFGDTDKGHINGTRIDLPKYFTYYPNYPADKKAGMSKIPGMDGYEIPENPFEGNVYNLLIPEDDLTLSDPDQKYSLYVKAIYTPESGLEPTFHALTALTNNPTGVESIIDNGENLDDAPVYFYNMNGVQIDGNNLTPGLYIRRQGATSTKVLIK